jgi:hypothetical protein
MATYLLEIQFEGGCLDCPMFDRGQFSDVCHITSDYISNPTERLTSCPLSALTHFQDQFGSQYGKYIYKQQQF